MNKFTASAQLDARIAIANMGGYDLSPFPRWHTPGVLTLRGAVELADWVGLKVERCEISHTKGGGFYRTHALVWVSGSTIASAAISNDEIFGEIVATGLAFRNAVQRVLFPKSPVWVGKPDDFTKEDFQ